VWGNSVRAADTLEYDFTGRVTDTTCKVELYHNGSVATSISGPFYFDAMPAIGNIDWNPVMKELFSYYFRVTCPSGNAATEVTGKISTSQEIDAATMALKNMNGDTNQFGIVLKDTDQNKMIDFSTVENTQSFTLEEDVRVADFNFDVGIVRYGESVDYGIVASSIVFSATFQ
jgi:type 1 fimbria pilin